jgi:hypothetical protein
MEMKKQVQDIALFIRPSIFSAHPQLLAAGSTRLGGVSQPPFASLNLGLSTDDDPLAVAENRLRFFAALGIDETCTASAYQVHGDAVLHVESPGRWEGYDALVTQQTGVYLCVTVADCTPILLWDPRQNIVAAVHAGWRGTSLRIVSKTLEEMRHRYGTNPSDCVAYIGTCIDACDYEVGADVADGFGPEFKRWDEGRQRFFLDLKKANKAQLLQAGVPEVNIEVSPYSTVKDNDRFFSYRKEAGQTGRMLYVIGIKP